MKCQTCKGRGKIDRKDNRYDDEAFHKIKKTVITKINCPVCGGVGQISRGEE